mgnify:CR=1 FL=1
MQARLANARESVERVRGFYERATSVRDVVSLENELANRTAVALADQLGTTVVDFPGDHGGFLAFPEQFGRLLDRVLTETT